MLIAINILGNAALGQTPDSRKLAFLTGVEKYQRDGFSDLSYCIRDVEELAAELRIQGFEVTTIVGKAATQAAIMAELRKFFESLRKLNKNDVVLVGFSGHGMQAQVFDVEKKQLFEDAFFCPVDGLRSDADTLISISWVMQQLERQSGSSQNLLLVDACRDNPGKGKNIDGSTARELPNKISVLFSSSRGQRSFESNKAQHGVFTHVLLEGLRGEAANKQGLVTWLNLASHVIDHVPLQVGDLVGNPKAEQRPNLMGNLVVQPVLARVDQRIPRNAKAGDERSDNGLGIKLVWCPPGMYTMGSPSDELDRSVNEGPVDVTLSSGLWLGRYEITQEEWSRLMRTTPWKGREHVKEGATYPATYVRWDAAVEFCAKLTEQERSAGRLASPARYRLPTEAEWEYACRAGTTTRFSFGDDHAELGVHAWYESNAWYAEEKFAHEVGRKRPNKWGLYDMHGNVLEWCEDRFSINLPGGRDPVVLQDGPDRVYRGGGWDRSAGSCRSANRFRFAPSFQTYSLGFRVALSPSGK